MIISTYFPNKNIVGSFGLATGELNREIFGYICFFYLFFFIKPIVSIYNQNLDIFGVMEKTLSLISFIYSLTLLQAIIVDGKMAGLLGKKSVEILALYIGSFGIFILSILILFLSLVILLDSNYQDLNQYFNKILNSNDKFKTLLKELKYTFFKSDIEFQNKFNQNYAQQTKNETPNFDEVFAHLHDISFLVDKNVIENDNPSVGIDFDELYEDAKKIILTDKKTSVSYIQKKLKIGYNRAIKIIKQLENMGVISQANNKGQREILD